MESQHDQENVEFTTIMEKLEGGQGKLTLICEEMSVGKFEITTPVLIALMTSTASSLSYALVCGTIS